MSPFSHVMLCLVLNEAPEKCTSFQNNAQNYILVLKWRQIQLNFLMLKQQKFFVVVVVVGLIIQGVAEGAWR